MHAFLLFLLLTAAIPLSGYAQKPVGLVLPHQALPGASSMRVGLPETVSEVLIEWKPKGSKTWKAWKKSLHNPAGGRELVWDVPKNLRGRDLRVKVGAVRQAPQTVDFTLDKPKARLFVKAGLASGTKVSVEYFDRAAKRWSRVSTAAAPEDSTKSWSVPVPRSRIGAALRVTRLDSKAPGSQSARFPAAFRTGKTKFAGREVSSSAGAETVLQSGPQLKAGDSKDSATAEVQESDIWKISGTQIYFFNQHRGLQVIETANPADPEIVSSLRMPAVGEDMYLLSGMRALLVRRDWMNGGTTGVVLVDASEPQARILAELDVPGWYVDSRLVAGRLVLATSEWNEKTWRTTTRLSVVESLNSKPQIASSRNLHFEATAMGTAEGRLWISGTKDWNWESTRVAVFPLAGLPTLGKPLELDLRGAIYDKFKIHIQGNALFAVTQSWGVDWRQSTAMESHSLAEKPPRLLQRLPLVEGESLHASRFDAGRAYIVTFEQIDPLWIVDLSDPAAMRIESELEVPGWSTYIQPVGGFLAAVGVENGKVTASLFDVRDPANPSLSSRVEVGEGYSWSEANWNEKAVAILPESNLILLPYSSFDAQGHVSAVQLVDMNAATGSLVKRGLVRHAFTPRRASALREGILASISNRELFLLDAANRDNPAMLSDTALAFGTDRILGSKGDFLVHAESGDWTGSAAVLRVSQLADADAVIAQASLGEGEILAAEMRGRHIVALLRSRSNSAEGRILRFDANQLPALVETGRSVFKLSSGWNPKADLLWPADDLVVAAIRWSEWNWWRGPWDDLVTIQPANASRRLDAIDIGIAPPFRGGVQSAVLQAFDLSTPAPQVASMLDLASMKPRNLSPFFAVDGLVVFSSDETLEDFSKSTKGSGAKRWFDHARLRIVDYSDPANPYEWPHVAVPGRLEHITDFDRSAGLVFVSAHDGSHHSLFLEAGEAHFLDSLPAASLRAFEGRAVWSMTGSGLARQRLSDQGRFVEEGVRKDLPFTPSALRAFPAGLLAQNGANLIRVPVDFRADLKSLKIPGWGWWFPAGLGEAIMLEDGAFAASAGEYGVEFFR